MTLRFSLSHHGSSTLEIGLVIDDDGHVTAYQTSGWRVGRFARDLSPAERTQLAAALETARSTRPEPGPTRPEPGPTRPEPVEGQPTPPRAPSGAAEQLVTDGLPDATFDPNSDPPPGLEDLVGFLRSVREDIAEHPVAAIELDVSGSPLHALLRHVGTGPVGVRSNEPLTCEAATYDADYLVVDSETHTVEVAALGDEVSPGWELGLFDRLELSEPPSGGFLSISVGPLGIDSVGDGVFRRAEFSWVSE